jgi:perosamine synthetase
MEMHRSERPHRLNPMNFFHTHISESSIQRATDALRSTFISEGKLVREFESRLASNLGLSRPVALNSGTTALHLGLVLAGVGPSDEVIIPAQTFIATGMVVLAERATPVFCDIDPETGNICPKSLARKISKKTKAVIPVHWAGYPCDLDEINATCTDSGIAVIEDAAHALGARYRGKPIGAISRFTAFSFQAIKHITTGDGGGLCCLREEDEKDARIRRWFAIDRANSQPSILGERLYDADRVGYKYHMNDLGAAVGLGNLKDFPKIQSRLAEIAAAYRKNLTGIDGIQLLRQDADRDSGNWLFTIRVQRREDFIRALSDRGVPTSVVHLRIDKNSVFGGSRTDLPGQEIFNLEQVSLPIHFGLSDSDFTQVVSAVKSGW